MADLQARIRILAETAQAVRDIKRIGQATTEAGAAIGKAPLAQGFDRAAAAADRAAAAAEKAAGRIAAAEARAAAEKTRVEAIVERQRLAATQRAASAEQKIRREATRKQTLVAPQITDIVTQLAGGQNPFLVAIQQGGQLRDVFGSAGAAAKALAAVFTPMRLAIGGVVAVAAGIATAMFQGYTESQKLAKAFALTGNVANITAGSVDRATAAIARSADVSVGAAREAAIAVASSGKFSEANVASVGRAMAAISKLTGESTEEALKQFTGLIDGTTEGAAKMNKAYSFLSVEQYKQIKTLEAQGRTQDAIKLISEQLASTLTQRTIPAIGQLEGAWSKVAKTLSEAWGWLKKIGGDTSAEERLAEINAKINRLRVAQEEAAGRPSIDRGTAVRRRAAELNELGQERSALNRTLLSGAEKAAAQATANAEIEKLSTKHQQALSQIEDAATAFRLAQQLQGLSARENAAEQERARGLLGEKQYTERINQLAIERLQIERAAAQARIASAGKDLVKGGTTAEQESIRARVTQLRAGLLGIDTQIAAARSKSIQDASRLQLEDARSQAQAYADVWSRAYQQIRQFAVDAQAARNRAERDPQQRAAADAAVATSEARAIVAELERDLRNQIKTNDNEGSKAALRAQLADLLRTADDVIAERTRSATFESLQAQSDRLQAQLAARESIVTERLNAGLITSTQAEAELLAIRREQVPTLERINALLSAAAETDDEKVIVANGRARLTALKDYRTELERTAQSSAVDNLAQSFNRATLEGDGFWSSMRAGVAGFGRAMVELINRKLAEQLVSQFIDAAGRGQSSGGGDFWTTLLKFFFSAASSSGGGSGYSSAGVADTTGGAGGSQKALRSNSTPSYLDSRAALVSPARRGATASASLGKSSIGGGISVSVPVNITTDGSGAGAGGGDSKVQRNAAAQLQQMVQSTVNDWATNQSRPGGMLYKGAR